jgi:hypothetical protein
VLEHNVNVERSILMTNSEGYLMVIIACGIVGLAHLWSFNSSLRDLVKLVESIKDELESGFRKRAVEVFPASGSKWNVEPGSRSKWTVEPDIGSTWTVEPDTSSTWTVEPDSGSTWRTKG